MGYYRTTRYFDRSRREITAMLVLTMAWFFINCQNNIVTIQEIKGTEWEQYIGKSTTVEGIFIKDTLPMLVTNLKIVTANVPMPYNQYLLLYGEEMDSIDPQKFGGARMFISGKVWKVEKDQIKYAIDKVILEVLSYEILEVPDLPYAPKVQNVEQDSLNP